MAEHAVPGARRSYANGQARRAEILAAALEVFAEQGYRGSSLRDIAAHTGVSAAGILHHFGSKDALLTAVLAERERLSKELFPVDSRPSEAADYFRDMMAYNSTQPGLVRLYATLAAEAVDPEHPAHAWFVERYARARDHVRAVLAEDLEPLREAEREATIQLFIAVSDGLQMQWLLEPDRDMRPGMDRFVDLYVRAKESLRVPDDPSGSWPGVALVWQRRLGSKGAVAADRVETLGHHGRRADGGVPASLRAEADAACAALGAALTARGSGWGDVIEVLSWHAPFTDSALEVTSEALQAMVGGRDVAWTAQAAAGLADAGLRIELGAIAIAPRSRDAR